MRTPVHAIRRCAIVLLLLAGADIMGCGRSETPLTLVFTPSRDPTALKEAADAFAKTLAEISGVPVRALVASDYAGVIEALRSRRVDLAFVHPVGYVLANREAGCRILVRDVWGGKTAYTARFYVRKDRGIRRVEDLRGKTVAFVDPASSSGYIYPMVLLMQRGLVRNRDPKTFFRDVVFAGSHDAAMRALVNGHVDAIASFDLAREQYLTEPAERDKIVVVAETPPIPEAGIAARDGLDPATFARVRAALLQIRGPAYAALLKRLYDIDGFEPAEDREYDPVRAAIELLGVRPR
jgi:phosphonate transport system substrate-binding protein